MELVRYFRICLLDENGLISAADTFLTRSYVEAADTAAVVYEACSDKFHGYELWCGSRRLVRVLGAPSADSDELDHLIEEHQDQVVALEESLKDNSFGVLASRKLLQSTERFLAGRYRQIIAPELESPLQIVERNDVLSDPEQIANLIEGAEVRIDRQKAIVLSLETNGHLDAAATARAVLATFHKSLMLLRRSAGVLED